MDPLQMTSCSVAQRVAEYVKAYEADTGEQPSAVRLCDDCVEKCIAELTALGAIKATALPMWPRVNLRVCGRPVLYEVICGRVSCYSCDVYRRVE